MKSPTAVILAGGKGKRLRPYTRERPKPMLDIGGKPILEHAINHLVRQGVTDLIFSVSYLRNHIQDYFGDGSDFGVSIDYVVDEPPRGTCGSIAGLEDQLSDPFLVLPGDILTDAPFPEMITFHEEKGGIATIGLFMLKSPMEFGIIRYDNESRIHAFKEKPILENPINTGIYLLDKKVFDYIEGEKTMDFSYDLFPALLADDQELYCYLLQGYWWDIGHVNDYDIAKQIGNILAISPGEKSASRINEHNNNNANRGIM